MTAVCLIEHPKCPACGEWIDDTRYQPYLDVTTGLTSQHFICDNLTCSVSRFRVEYVDPTGRRVRSVSGGGFK